MRVVEGPSVLAGEGSLHLRRQNGSGAGEHPFSFEGMVGTSPRMQNVFATIADVAPTDAAVLVCGESGTGKELVARAIHRRSGRSAGPFVALNMAAMPGELIESTLFGHERGAFTGADRQHMGACEEADGGTLFLDEITEMPLEQQPKLLRFLQEQSFRRVGGRQELRSSVRVVAATNRDPAEEVRAGRLRVDLYYRLAVVPIELPALREREGDIELLVRHFLRVAVERYRKQPLLIEPDAMQRLVEAPWSGNVRQLCHVMERLVVLSHGSTITAAMLPEDLDQGLVAANPATRLLRMAYGIPHDPEGTTRTPFHFHATSSAYADTASHTIMPMVDVERQAIERALTICHGSPVEAARKLGISTATIYRKIRQFRITPGTVPTPLCLNA